MQLSQVQGKSWQKLVQGRACGALVPSDSPPEECPADLCRNQTVRWIRPPEKTQRRSCLNAVKAEQG